MNFISSSRNNYIIITYVYLFGILLSSEFVCSVRNSYLKDYYHRGHSGNTDEWRTFQNHHLYKLGRKSRVNPARLKRPSTGLDNLIYKLDDGNRRLKNSIHLDFGSTVNEVDDTIDYYADQKDVQRAWSKDSKMSQRTRDRNLHIISLATQNVNTVLKTAKCEQATRRCMNVHKMQMSTDATDSNGKKKKKKNYWPNCALVHKCDHDSGCCKDPKHICSPVQTELIKLHFFTFDVFERMNGSVAVERLTFENHTLCDCRPSLGKSLEDIKNCMCPVNFYLSLSSGECHCNCDHKKNRPCRKIRKGKRTYHMRGCHGARCSPPLCEYGNFMSDLGRCPRKSERMKKLTDMYEDLT